MASLLNLLKRFVAESRTDLELALRMQDKDRGGILTTDELKTALTDSGFRVTNVRKYCRLNFKGIYCPSLFSTEFGPSEQSNKNVIDKVVQNKLTSQNVRSR